MMSPSSAFSNCDAGNLDVLVYAEDVGELKAKESNVVLRREIENVLLARAGRISRGGLWFWVALGVSAMVGWREGSSEAIGSLAAVSIEFVHTLHDFRPQIDQMVALKALL